MSEGHVSNFYIVDLENFATASRRSIVVGLLPYHRFDQDCTAAW